MEAEAVKVIRQTLNNLKQIIVQVQEVMMTAVLATLKDGGYGNANGTGGKVVIFYMIARKEKYGSIKSKI